MAKHYRIECGVTGNDWEPTAATRYYAQVTGSGEAKSGAYAFGDTYENALRKLMGKVENTRDGKRIRRAIWRKLAAFGYEKTVKAMYREDSVFFVMGDFAACNWTFTRYTTSLSHRKDHFERARQLDQAAREHGFYLP